MYLPMTKQMKSPTTHGTTPTGKTRQGITIKTDCCNHIQRTNAPEGGLGKCSKCKQPIIVKRYHITKSEFEQRIKDNLDIPIRTDCCDYLQFVAPDKDRVSCTLCKKKHDLKEIVANIRKVIK